jgi:MOSC domain-containing protein YiiM
MAEHVDGWVGRVEGIFVAPAARARMVSVPEAAAVAGLGLEGDRYFEKAGTYSQTTGTGRQVTLIELEAIEAATRDGVELQPGDPRRNIVTAGVPLNHLVGREFLVGEARLIGRRLCEPCAHMARLAGNRRGTVRALIHRGGLRADILSGGQIRVGDRVRPSD